MTSRERVLASIAHKEPDRVPMDHGSMRSTGLMAIAYNRLKQHLGIEAGPTFMYDLIQQLAQPDDWYLERFHFDCVDVGRAFTCTANQKPWTLPDGSPAVVPAWFEPEYENGDLLVRSGKAARRSGRDRHRGREASENRDQAATHLACSRLALKRFLPI